MRRSAASTRSRARSRSNRVYRRGSDSIRFFRGDARSPNGRRMSLRPTPVDFFAISSSLHAPRLRRRETEMRPKLGPLKAMRPSRDHPETCGRVGVNFVKSEKRADREPQKRLHRRFQAIDHSVASFSSFFSGSSNNRRRFFGGSLSWSRCPGPWRGFATGAGASLLARSRHCEPVSRVAQQKSRRLAPDCPLNSSWRLSSPI